MSLTPATPNIKSFWERPEGKTGMIFVGAGAVAALYGLYFLLPFLITIVSNAITLGFLVAGLFAFIYIVTNKSFQLVIGTSFKLLMRWLTGLVITIDPIGILKQRIKDMKESLANLDDQIDKMNGAKVQLREQIDVNSKKSTKEFSLAEEAKRQQGNAKDPLVIQQLSFKISEHAAQAGRLNEVNKDLGATMVQMDRIYQLLCRWRMACEYYINDRENTVNTWTMKYKALKVAHSAMQSAKAILRGDPNAQELYDRTLEFLAEDAGNKLGEMESFARSAENFMSNVDLENGALAQDALKQLEAFEAKLLPAGNDQSLFADMATTQQPQLEPTPVKMAQAGANDDYTDLINKK